MTTTVEHPAGQGGASPWPPDPAGSAIVPPGPASPQTRRPETLTGRLSRRIHLRTVPARTRALSAVAVLAVAVLFAVASWAVSNARSGLQTIGHDAGPQVVATGSLFFALNDMDAQVANVLLIGRNVNLGRGRGASLKLYEQRRAEANHALLQAAQLAGDSKTEQGTVRGVLDGLGRYERLASQAMLVDQQQAHPAGPPTSPQVINLYRQANDLMKLELLPQAYNLTLDSGTVVRKTYESKHSSVVAGRTWVLVTGLLVIAALLAVQIFLFRRFKRLVNPALAVATVGTLVLLVAAVGLLSSQAGRLQTAKRDGFDSVLALSRARAVSNSAYADASRSLLDPDRADTYEQTYFDKSQSILYLDAEKTKSLGDYQANLAGAVGEFDQPGRSTGVSFLGFFGDEARQAGAAGDGAGPVHGAVAKVLGDYRTFQQNDRRIRDLSAANRPQALAQHLGRADFESYDQALVNLTNLHRKTFDEAIHDGDEGLRGWKLLLPGASLVIVALILVGVRPRLAEYR